MTEMLMFGDVFFYLNEEYVYLAMGESGILYAARILTMHESTIFVKEKNKAIKLEGEKRTSEKIVYCFVQLKTVGYSDRIAHLNQAGSQKNEKAILRGIDDKTICLEDMLNLRDEILAGPVPKDLRNQIEALDFEGMK